MSMAIWRKSDDEWRPLLPAGFPSEAALHDLVQEAPNLLPLSGDPTITCLGREVGIGPGLADIVAVDADGQLTIIEIKLRRNAEARRAVVAQVLTYAAYLKGLGVEELEALLRTHLAQIEAASVADAVARSDQSGQFQATVFNQRLAQSLADGAFRLVLVLDEAPSELVQLVGYLESISSGVVIDLIAVSAFDIGDEQILVPRRVDPAYQPDSQPSRTPSAGPPPRREVDGSDAFEAAIENASPGNQAALRRVLHWARALEAEGLATLRTNLGAGNETLLVWVRGERAGLASVYWFDGGVGLSLWRSVFVRLAPTHIERVEQLSGKTLGPGTTVKVPSDELLSELTSAYRAARSGQAPWNGRDYYVSFGEDERRDWDDARTYGFVAAGGGAWYSKTIKNLKPGNRIFVYIPKGSGVGGYVGVGEVTGEARLAKEFSIHRDGTSIPYLDVAKAPEAGKDRDDPALAEWVVPVRWIKTRERDDAVKDSDFFAQQNSAAKLTHRYTLQKLDDAFELDPEPASGSSQGLSANAAEDSADPV